MRGALTKADSIKTRRLPPVNFATAPLASRNPQLVTCDHVR